MTKAPLSRDEAPADDPGLRQAQERGMVTPFMPGTIVTSNALLIDKVGIAWWVRPDSMMIFRARAPVVLEEVADAEKDVG